MQNRTQKKGRTSRVLQTLRANDRAHGLSLAPNESNRNRTNNLLSELTKERIAKRLKFKAYTFGAKIHTPKRTKKIPCTCSPFANLGALFKLSHLDIARARRRLFFLVIRSSAHYCWRLAVVCLCMVRGLSRRFHAWIVSSLWRTAVA